MNANDEGVKPPTDARSVARAISAAVLVAAIDSASGVLKELVGDGVSAVMHALVTALTKTVWSADVKAKSITNLKETIDV
jgi:hypothetical protein